MAPNRPSRAIDFALIHYLFHRLGYPDSALAAYLSKGMPSVGDVLPTNVSARRGRPVALDIQSWRDGAPQRNQEMVNRAKRDAPTEMARFFWEKTLAEYRDGWVALPAQYAVSGNECPSVVTNVCHRGRAWGRAKKIRFVVDLNASGANDLVGFVVTPIPENLVVLPASPQVNPEIQAGRAYQAPPLLFACVHARRRVFRPDCVRIDHFSRSGGRPSYGDSPHATLR